VARPTRPARGGRHPDSWPRACHSRLPSLALRRRPRAAAREATAQDTQLKPGRLSLEGLSTEERAEAIDEMLASLDRPVLVTGALPDLDAEAWLGQLLSCLQGRETEFQVQGDQSSELCVGTLEEAVNELVTDSSHGDAVFIMDEGLLADAADELRAAVALPEAEWGPNWFRHFPAQLRPGDCALIGGASARSTLHADPFSWQGYNLLLEGAKVWTFLPPSTPRASVLRAYRLEPNAWGGDDCGGSYDEAEEESYAVSAGWQSPVNLYWRRAELRGEEATAGGAAPDGTSFDVPLGAGAGLRFRPSHDLAADTLAGATVFVQREGELLLIPPDWWHQTYHLSPTVAVASQLLNAHCEASCFRHIMRWTGAAEPPGLSALAEPRDRVRVMVDAAVRARYGPQLGASIAARLEWP